MQTAHRTSVALSVLAVLVIVGIAAAVGGSGSGASVSGTPSRAVAYQPPPVQDLSAFKLAPAQTNTVYVAITPCRIVDTRVAGGKFVDGTNRVYYVAGTTGFESQGGKAGGCGIPLAATSIAATFQATNEESYGYMRAWPANIATEPTATVVIYNKAIPTTSGGNITVQPGVAKSLTVRNHAGKTDLVIDVTGYYVPQMHGMVGPGGSIYAGSSRIVSATNPSVGQYVVTFDSPITYCTPVVDTYNAGSGIYGAAYSFSGNTATVYTWYINGTTHVETLNSFYFYIAVLC